MKNEIKIETLHLFSVLDSKLIQLLKQLTLDEWDRPTVAKFWKVKDVASHLLDGNLRALSTSRDKYLGEKPEKITSYQDLVGYLNQLNMSWTNATKRISPQLIINLLEITGQEYTNHLKTLNPFDEAIFSVAWSGQQASPNWFHIAREYTEKFLHQQQIRDAVGKQEIMTKELFYPFIDTLMFAFPYTFRSISAAKGTIVTIEITTEIGGIWNIVKKDTSWELDKSKNPDSLSRVVIDPETAWKLFSKSWKPEQVLDKVEISGDITLGKHALTIVAVMA